MSDEAHPEPPAINMAEALGAERVFSVQCFTVYIPNKDKNNLEFGTQRMWVLEAIRLLTSVNGGATAVPVEGGWANDEGKLILEEPVVVYSHLTDTDRFMSSLPEIRKFLHRMGR
jgi:hypothetical protein